MDAWARMMVGHRSLKVMIGLHRMFTETDFRPELPKISVPALLIHGALDSRLRGRELAPAGHLLISIGMLTPSFLPLLFRSAISDE